MRDYPPPGERVRLGDIRLDDIPPGSAGTVVGVTHAGKGAEVIVKFDHRPHVRYLRPREIEALTGDGKGA